VAALLAAADLFCLTSRREGVPVSILEAMAAGRAVVATDVGGVREQVVEGETALLVPPGDPGAFARAVAALLADPARRGAFGAAGQARARARFTVERAAAAIAAVYAELLGR
jgi:glycosyltransferase involved in cell wall biosynthesis